MPRLRCPRALAKIATWGTDLFAMLLVFAVLTVYDCGILGGIMRLPHLVTALVGFFFALSVYRKFLHVILSRILVIALELLLLPIGLSFYPFRIAFSVILSLCRRLVLLCRKKCAKIRENKEIKRYTENQIRLASEAFLPGDANSGSFRVA